MLFKRILLPFDGSATAEQVLPHAIAQDEKFGAVLILLGHCGTGCHRGGAAECYDPAICREEPGGSDRDLRARTIGAQSLADGQRGRPRGAGSYGASASGAGREKD